MRRSLLIAGITVLLATVGYTSDACRALGCAEQDAKGGVLTTDLVDELLSQQARLLEEVERMRGQLERLARIARETQSEPERRDDLVPLMNALASDDYSVRDSAARAMRRSLVDRMWLFIEAPDLGPEVRQRMKSILVETSAMIRLTTVAVDLQPGDRDALWNLLDTDPAWLLDALGDDPERVESALRKPPPNHTLAVEIVLAALVRDHMRPVPQSIALDQVRNASSPLLRSALQALLADRARVEPNQRYSFMAERDRSATRAIRILARRPSDELVDHLVTYLRSAESFSAQLEFTIVEALVNMGARRVAPDLIAVAEEKRGRTSGSQRYENLIIRPGDSELIGAALLLEMNLDELKVGVRRARTEREPDLYGFAEPQKVENPDRAAAYEAVRRAANEARGSARDPD